jgi:hypothetical protein
MQSRELPEGYEPFSPGHYTDREGIIAMQPLAAVQGGELQV